MVDEVEVDGEDRVAVDLVHGPGGDAAAGEVEGHVPPVVAPHAGRQPDLADDLAEPMQGLLGVLPGGQRDRWEQLHACPSVTRLGSAGCPIGAPGQRHASRLPACLAARADPGCRPDQPCDQVGWEAGEAWLERTSTVLAPMRPAMNRSRSGLIIRSWVDTRNHEGSVFHAGGPARSVKHLAAIGFCTAARTRASSTWRSWAKLAGIAAGSNHRKPSESGWVWARPGGGGNRLPSSPRLSPSSGAKAEANTRPITLGTPVAALEITAPP